MKQLPYAIAVVLSSMTSALFMFILMNMKPALAVDGGSAEVIRTRSLELVDENGTILATLKTDRGKTFLEFIDQHGKSVLTLGQFNGSASVDLNGDHSLLSFSDASGSTLISLGLAGPGASSLDLASQNSDMGVSFAVSPLFVNAEFGKLPVTNYREHTDHGVAISINGSGSDVLVSSSAYQRAKGAEPAKVGLKASPHEVGLYPSSETTSPK